MKFRVLGRFHGDPDRRFVGPHRVCFDCDLVLDDPKADRCGFCWSTRIGQCGGPRQGSFLGCAACDQEAGR
jgi:hypothetical protein